MAARSIPHILPESQGEINTRCDLSPEHFLQDAVKCDVAPDLQDIFDTLAVGFASGLTIADLLDAASRTSNLSIVDWLDDVLERANNAFEEAHQ